MANRYLPVAASLYVVLFAGCGMSQKAPSLTNGRERTETPLESTIGTETSNRTGDTLQTQQGGLNAAVGQATGMAWTKTVNEATPAWLGLLLAYVVTLSHRREAIRIRQNGKPPILLSRKGGEL